MSTLLSAVAALTLMVLTGCTAGTAEPEQGGASTGSVPEKGPLELAFGRPIFHDYSQSDVYIRNLPAIEEEIARCMAEQGFDYHLWPHPIPVLDLGIGADAADGEWGSLSYRKLYGFGTTTDPPEEDSDPETKTNPNFERLATMNVSERTEWTKAYSGENEGFTVPFELTDGQIAYTYNWKDAGCKGYAEHTVLRAAGETHLNDPRFMPIGKSINELGQAYTASADLAEIYADWADCMKSAGYPDLEQTPDALAYVDDLVQNQASSGLSDQQIRDIEIAVAVADYECYVDNRIKERALELRYEMEAEFVEKHRGEIEVLLQEVAATPWTDDMDSN